MNHEQYQYFTQSYLKHQFADFIFQHALIHPAKLFVITVVKEEPFLIHGYFHQFALNSKAVSE